MCNIENVLQSCDTCIRFKQIPPRPAVGLAKAKDFSETVSIDLYEIHTGLYYFHMMDEFSRYNNAVVIKNKL